MQQPVPVVTQADAKEAPIPAVTPVDLFKQAIEKTITKARRYLAAGEGDQDLLEHIIKCSELLRDDGALTSEKVMGYKGLADSIHGSSNWRQVISGLMQVVAGAALVFIASLGVGVTFGQAKLPKQGIEKGLAKIMAGRGFMREGRGKPLAGDIEETSKIALTRVM